MAFHNFHDTNKMFPFFTQVIPNRQNWAPFVMPYLEQGNLVRGYDLNTHWYNAPTLAVTQNSLPIFSCPSDRPRAMWTDQAGYVSARANYLVCYGNVTFGNNLIGPGRGGLAVLKSATPLATSLNPTKPK